MSSRLGRRSSERRAAFLSVIGAGCRPKDFPIGVIAHHRAIESSPERARRALATEIPRAYRRRVRAVALGLERRRPSDFSHLRSRRIVALAVTLWRLSRRSRRHGMRRVVQGFTGAQLATLSVNPRTGKPCQRSAYTASSWGASRKAPDDCGILAALTRSLEGTSLLFVQQPKPELCDARYVGPPKVIGVDELGRPITRRFAFAVYWWREPPD